MASLEDAFITQINTGASARNPNAYIANQQTGMWQQEPEWTQQFSHSWQPAESQGWNQPPVQESQGWVQQPQREWLQPKQSQQQPYQQQRQQAVNDAVSVQQAVEQIAHQHRFQPAELKLQPDEPSESHWWFIRPRTGVEYCYPKRFNYRAGDE